MNSTHETTPAATGTTLNPPARRFGCGVYDPDQALLFQCATIEQANRAVEMVNILAAEVIRLTEQIAAADAKGAALDALERVFDATEESMGHRCGVEIVIIRNPSGSGNLFTLESFTGEGTGSTLAAAILDAAADRAGAGSAGEG